MQEQIYLIRIYILNILVDICGNNLKYNGWIFGIVMYFYVELKKDRCDC